MKALKLTIVIISILILSSCNRNDINDKSKRNGDWIWWVDAKTGEGKWIHSSNQTTVKDGRYTSFYFNGNIYTKGKLIDGKEVDTITVYNIYGKPDWYHFINPTTICRYFITDKDTVYYYFIHDGLHKLYNNYGHLVQQGYTKNHSKYGQWIGYDENGFKKFVRNFVEDSGWNNHYYTNGQIEDSGFDFNNDGTYATCKRWFENGQIEREAQWRKGTLNGMLHVQEGTAIQYTEKDDQPKSVIKCISNWKDGVQDGIALNYYDNGQLQDSLNWVKGERDGICKHWYENGKLQLVLTYEDGNLISEQEYDENGKLIN